MGPVLKNKGKWVQRTFPYPFAADIQSPVLAHLTKPHHQISF